MDQDGRLLSDASVTWSSSDDQVASVTQSGLVVAEGAGSAMITATAGAAIATAQVSVVQTPIQLQKVAGDAQTGIAGQTLASPLVVQVNDAGGRPIPGVSVTFSVTAGEGSLVTVSTTTGPDGRAATTFTLGTIAGSPQAVSATVTATALTVSFSAVAASDPTSFNIGLQYLSPATPTQREAFTSARQRWESAITDDIADLFLEAGAGTCGLSSPEVSQSIDDLVILVRIAPIDGPGGTLGIAGPCYVRTSNLLTVLGVMEFDTEDLEMIETQGFLPNVILHEMGHVLGIGTIWDAQGLLADPSLPDNPGADPHFTGPQGIAAFDDVGGVAYVGGAKVPVENTGGPGTADGHWRETVLDAELMTGFIGPGVSPLSVVTLASLADLGYVVDLAAADPYSLLLAVRAFGDQQKARLLNDIFRGPIRMVDANGRVTGMLRK